MKQTRRWSPGLRVAGVLIAFGVLAWTFRDLDLARVSEAVGRVGGPLLLLVLLPMGCSLAVESLGWTWAFRRAGHDVPFVGIWRARVTSEALALTLPAGMLFCESTKPFLLKRHCGLRAEVSIAGMAVRKYLLLASQSVYIGGFALLGAAFIEQASPALIGGPGLTIALLVISAVVFAAALASGLGLRDGRIAERVRSLLARLPLPVLRQTLQQSRGRFVSTDAELQKFLQGSLLSSTVPALPFLLSWIFEAVETYLILRLLGVDLPFEAVGALEVALSFVRHVTFILPAGLGVQDLGYVAFLRALGADDPLVMGAAFVLIKRAKECVYALVGFLLLAADLRATSAVLPSAAVPPAGASTAVT